MFRIVAAILRSAECDSSFPPDYRGERVMPLLRTGIVAIATLVLSSLTVTAAEKPNTGTLAGVIRFKGTPPARKPLHKRGDPSVNDLVCRKHEIPDERLIVDPKTRGIANVVVYLERRPKGYKAAVPKTPAVLAIEDCRYTPHVMVLRVGQMFRINNAGDTVHNVHSLPLSPQNTTYNVTVAAGKGSLEMRFMESERLPLKVKDDIHPWMLAWQLPLDHPFAAVTGSDGKFEIKGLPPGKHGFVVWHEKAGYLERALEVEIKAKTTTRVKQSYGPRAFK
jgi:hypothetical protein